MPQIVLTKKSYHDRKGRPPPIKDGDKLCTGGWTVPFSNDNGGPFGKTGKRPPRGGNSNPLEGGDS